MRFTKFDVNGSKNPTTACCPGHSIPNTLTAVFSGRTGRATQLPDTLTLTHNPNYGNGNYWTSSIGVTYYYNNTNYVGPEFEIRVACSQGLWYNADGGATTLVTGDGRSAQSASCDPLSLVFYEEKTDAQMAGGAMSYTMTVSSMSPHALRLTLPYYYEWSVRESKWMKFSDEDPEPPSDLQAGQFDGQITEVSR